MIANDLPTWLPVFNMIAAAAAVILAVLGLRSLWTYRAALAVALMILLEDALFQANIMPLWAWVVFGSGGRLLLLAAVVAETVLASRPPVQRVSLADISAQLNDIRSMTGVASESAEQARTAASAADDRMISQAERAVDDRTRTGRIEDAIAENTDLTKLAAEAADHAYHEANSVNEKIASQGAVIVRQGAEAVTDRERGARIEDVSIDTNQRTIDIQERLP